MAEHLVLGDERRGHVLRDHEAGVEPAVDGQERRQALREARVDEPLDAPLGDARELGDGHRERVERERERLAVEVPVRDDEPLVDEDERVVRRRVQLDRDGRLDVVEQVARRRRAPAAAQRSEYASCTLSHQRCDSMIAEPSSSAQDVRRRVALARAAGAASWIAGMEARPRALQRLERERAREVGRPREPPRTHEPERAIAAMNCVPLMSERPSFAASRIGSSPTRRERVGARQQLAVDPRLALADERQREVRERREIAARADRAARRDVRQHAAVEALDSSSTVSTRAPE